MTPKDKGKNMLEIQQLAPDFTTVNQRDESISLNTYKGKENVELYC